MNIQRLLPLALIAVGLPILYVVARQTSFVIAAVFGGIAIVSYMLITNGRSKTHDHEDDRPVPAFDEPATNTDNSLTTSQIIAVKLAQGDYGGTIEKLEVSLLSNPRDTFAISEIARILSRYMHDTQGAIRYLEQVIGSQTWNADQGAFLMMRVAELKASQSDFNGARQVLNDLISTYPDSKHLAQATHRLHEADKAAQRSLPGLSPRIMVANRPLFSGAT